MKNMIEIDGHKAVPAFDPEIKMFSFRGERARLISQTPMPEAGEKSANLLKTCSFMHCAFLVPVLPISCGFPMLESFSIRHAEAGKSGYGCRYERLTSVLISVQG
jgi:hypothetical protein